MWQKIRPKPREYLAMEINRHNLMKLAYLGDKGMKWTHNYSSITNERSFTIELMDGVTLTGKFDDYLAKDDKGNWWVIPKKEYAKEYDEV